MSSTSRTKPHLDSALEATRQFHDNCAAFEQALRRGASPALEGIVAAAPAGEREPLFRKLLTLEMEFRSKGNATPSFSEYRARFPDQVRLAKYLYFEHFVPERVGEFSIQKLLGRGGFGLVYQGWDAKLSRHVAIKVFRRDPDDLSPPGGGLLFEARTAAQLRHPGIVTVYAVLPDADGDEFLVLEYVDGKSLEDLLCSERLTGPEAARLMLGVVQALQHSHLHGLVHRDLKPANILLDQGRRPRVTDFGLALDLMALRRSPEIAGTFPYMAPEQTNGETHRLHARTDLWAVGVILYRMLCGRLPFSGGTRQELCEAIRHLEPEDLLHRDPSISPELARIVRKCLAKRMSERYQSAAELADDLAAFLGAPGDSRRADSAANEPEVSAVAVVPKGLRCFDAGDREFFLHLVPGPRDRHGVPEGIRFWEGHLRQTDANQTFRVGLLYGPSGCGKSSLVRAGIVPRLPANVQTLVIEATREGTESALMRELRRRFPDLTRNLSLSETLAELREGECLPPGGKLVIVLDQFEQWLHGWRHDDPAELIDALRQCDGGSVQALLLVRDDFWMPATRLFQRLDVPLVEGFNAAAVDLFDRTHAAKVLTAFGAAYGRVELDPARRPPDQQRFLERAVAELETDGWIVPVRLCIFAEMVKSRTWSPATLRDVGGAQGLGAVFLEEVFDGRMASPMHRLHRKAARSVLERLLPPGRTEIRGHLVSEAELRAVSGYAQQPDEFAALLRCLDHELRLITPSENESVVAGADADGGPSRSTARRYQLTHDFLVRAIRGWLDETRQRTFRGRAELRLADYAEAYATRPVTRALPSLREWLGLLVLTRARGWRATERAMMRRATRYHALRYGGVAAAAVLLGVIVYDRMAAIHAQGLVQALATSDSRDLPAVVGPLAHDRSRTQPLLVERLASPTLDRDQRARVLLGLVAVQDPRIDELFDQLVEADPPLVVAIAEIMARYGQLENLQPRLWSVAANSQEMPSRRLRACVALARAAPAADAGQWQAIGPSLVPIMFADVAANPGNFTVWMDALAPARKQLMSPLRQLFADERASDADRLLAANILAQYASDDVAELVELALQSTSKQFVVFDKPLGKHVPAWRAQVAQEAAAPSPTDASEDDKDRLARRRANGILLLRAAGDEQPLWPALEHRPDPRLRSFLIHHLRQIPTAAASWIEQLNQQRDAGVRQALVLILGDAAYTPLTSSQRADLMDVLLRIYRDDVDSGVHGAAQWALSRLGCDAQLEHVLDELASFGIRPGYHWYVTKSKLTMILFDPPGPVQLGSPTTEPGRDASDEALWTRDVDWSFAVSATEITQALYKELCPSYKEFLNEHAPDETNPANAVTWLDAERFCRLLSERDGIAPEEMAVPADESLRKRGYPDFLTHSGYRLPVEIEWEVACRAGTVTPRFFGYAPDLLSSYCWYIANAGGQTQHVGGTLPNAAGLFDMLGNVSEWCHDIYVADPAAESAVKAPGFLPLASYAVRGHDYASNARTVRTANRQFILPSGSTYSRGFRIAHTVRAPRSDE